MLCSVLWQLPLFLAYAQCDPQNTEVYLLATFRFHTRQRNPWLVKELLNFSTIVLHVVICFLNKSFVDFYVAVFCCCGSNNEQLKFLDAWKGHRSFVFMMCYWTDTYIGHCPPSYFTVAQHFGNSLQNKFYRQCPVFCRCVNYATLCIFDLNFWSHLWSQTANQERRISGVENNNWYTTMKTMYIEKVNESCYRPGVAQRVPGS
jgi:hypothetical protein